MLSVVGRCLAAVDVVHSGTMSSSSAKRAVMLCYPC